MASASSSSGDLKDEDQDARQNEANDSENNEEDDESGLSIDFIQKLLAQKLSLGSSKKETSEKKVLESVSFDGIIQYMKSDKCKNIIVMVGAGISTSAGIPDFRSPTSGLYSKFSKYNLPSPESMFDISYFKENPEPFFKLAKELYPGIFCPTPCHYFIRMLSDKGLLLRLYTQNIDTLERIAGIPEEKIVEAHGTFNSSHCLDSSCNTEYSLKWMKEKIFSDIVPTCEKCNQVVKPDVVFFGEQLPTKFFRCVKDDFKRCDLLVIIGTSLTVQPFSNLVDSVSESTPRFLINGEIRGETNPLYKLLGLNDGLDFNPKTAYRDVAWIGLCDDGCLAVSEELGWKDELLKIIDEEKKKLDVK